MCINCIHCSNAQQSLVIKEVSDRVLRQQQGELTSWLCWKALALTQVRSSRWQVRSDRMGASWLNNSLAYLSAANMNNYRYETIFLLVIIMSIKQFPASYLKSCTHVCFVSKKKKKIFFKFIKSSVRQMLRDHFERQQCPMTRNAEFKASENIFY